MKPAPKYKPKCKHLFVNKNKSELVRKPTDKWITIKCAHCGQELPGQEKQNQLGGQKK
jgi:hypothetical protein